MGCLKITLAKELVDASKNEVSSSGNISEDNIKGYLNNILANKIEEIKQTILAMDEFNGDDGTRIMESER